MTNQARIQTHINRGYNKAAIRLGTKFVQYRPLNTGPVFDNDNIVGEQFFSFDQDYNFGHLKPQDYNNARYFALTDLSHVAIGDYFWDWNDLIFFVANIEPLRPAELMRCNRTISIYRPSGSVDNGYGGDTDPITILTNWPCVLLPGTKGEMNIAQTPGSIRSPWAEMRIPAFPGGVIDPYDLFIDDLGRRFVVSTQSLALQGWYCTCAYEGA